MSQRLTGERVFTLGWCACLVALLMGAVAGVIVGDLELAKRCGVGFGVMCLATIVVLGMIG